MGLNVAELSISITCFRYLFSSIKSGLALWRPCLIEEQWLMSKLLESIGKTCPLSCKKCGVFRNPQHPVTINNVLFFVSAYASFIWTLIQRKQCSYRSALRHCCTPKDGWKQQNNMSYNQQTSTYHIYSHESHIYTLQHGIILWQYHTIRIPQ